MISQNTFKIQDWENILEEPQEADKGQSPWNKADYQKDLFEGLYRPLTAQQKLDYGLTYIRVKLSENRRFELWRNVESAFVIDKTTGEEYRVRLVDATKERDRHKRFKASRKALIAIPRFTRSLARTGLFKSMNSDSTDIYLARLSAALNGQKVEWDTGIESAERLNVHHISHCCSDDRASNLMVLTAKEHYELEKREYEEMERQVARAA